MTSQDDLSIVIKVLLVNGESRSVKLVENTEVTDIIYYILTRLHANMEVSPLFFGILLYHEPSGEHHWLTPGYSVLDLIASHCGSRPLEQWRFYLRIRVLPKTPQHLFSQDPVAFSYYYDQVLHMYLEDDSIVVDNDTALKLGCLEIRRFFRDTSEQALRRRENIAMLEREYGFQRFFKKSFLQSTRKRNLNRMIQSMFQQFESLTRDGCIFQFFSILGRFHPLDSECFNNCAIGEDSSAPLTFNVSVGPTCEVECETEAGDRRHIVSFNDIHEVRYEPEFTTRGRVIVEMKTSSPVVIRTAQLVTAVHLATLIDGYCQVYTPLQHSRIMTSETPYYNECRRDNMMSLNEIPFDPSALNSGYSSIHNNSEEGDYATVSGDSDKFMKALGRPLSPRDVLLGERIGEGQFGDVHTGVLYPDTTEEARVAVKTCKADSAPEEKAKFLQEAAVMKQFNHLHIIKLFGVVTQGYTTYIVMELAPLGQLRQYLIQKDMEIARSTLLEYIRQLCSAMVHLETKNYVHRDIAARNILVVAPDKIKLSDFGLSRWLEEADFYVASRGKLPIKWMAPESINFRRFTGASDVWMFGVCCWEILMRGVKPFMGIKNDEVIGKLELGERLALPPECPGPLFNLLNHCWQYDAEDRPTFKDLEQQIEYILDDEWQLMKGMARGRGYDGPPLPPRNPSDHQWNRRSGNIEDHRLLMPTLSSDSSISPPPALPPRPPTNNSRPLPSEPMPPPQSTSPSIRLKPHGSDSSVDPYLITNIPGALPTNTSSSSVFSPPSNHNHPPPSPINRHQSTSPIPPPAILRNQQQRQPTPPTLDEKRRSGMGMASEGVYYSTVSGEDEETIQKSVSQLKLSREPSPYEVSLAKEQMSPASNTSSLNDISEDEDGEDDDDNNEVLEHTTGVVKTVMALNTQLPEAKPGDYPELVKGVGVALRELLAKVDQEMESLPEQTHQKVQMAHKVLSSDMGQLVKAMKDLQENYHSFVVDHYQKQMLQSAAIIAVNSKHLLEAYNKARRLSRRSQR